MQGVWPIPEESVRKIFRGFAGRMRARDACMFKMQLYTGFRISEVLSLKWGDVYQNRQFMPRITVYKRNMKKKTKTNSKIMHPDLEAALKAWLLQAKAMKNYSPEYFLFGQQNQPGKAISRSQAWRVYNRAIDRAGLVGRFGTHSPRKTHIKKGHQLGGNDPAVTMKISMHTRMDSLMHYLPTTESRIDDIVLQIAF